MYRPKYFPVRWQAAWLALALTLFGLAGLPRAANAQAVQRPAEIGRQVKAAYLYKFAGFVEWPGGTFADPKAPLIVGILGDDALADDLERMVAGRLVAGRPFNVLKLRPGDPLAGLHILFIGRLEKLPVLDVLLSIKGQPVLSVTDAPDAYELGCMIKFVVAEERLRFEVALPAVESARLKISALMLAAAFRVVKGSM